LSRRAPGGFSAARIAKRVAELGRAIRKDYRWRRVDVVVTMDRGFMFAADLIRHLDGAVACHFLPEDVRDVDHGGHTRREVSFRPWPELKGRDVLLVDGVLDSGVTQEFLLRWIGESQPRSLRLAVLLDKSAGRRVALEPDYFAFRTASKERWAGYGLCAPNGLGRNLLNLSQGKTAVAGRKKR